MVTDVLRWADDELARARAHLTDAVDQVDALVELRSLTFGIAAEAGQATLTLDDVDRLTDERTAARLRALARRAINPTNQGDTR